MIGYVTCEKPEMKIRDFEVYSGYYCGICKSIGRRYGQLQRMSLSYDMAFLASLLSGLETGKDQICREHCVIHHITKKTVIKNRAVDYAGDVMLLLAWYKLRDDAADENRISAGLLSLAMKKKFRKIEDVYPELAMDMQSSISEIGRLEEEKCSDLDLISDNFAHIMESVFTCYETACAPDPKRQEHNRRLLKHLGYMMGKWIYLIDAYDDLEKDIASGAYNPLIYRYGYDGSQDPADFRKSVREQCERNLLIYCSEMEKTVDLLDIKKNKGIIENIVYMGLLRRTDKVLGKEEKTDGKPL